jgi:hypothetical protein
LTTWLSRGSAVLALLALALIPASAQLPRAADAARRIEIHAQAIEAFDAREPGQTRFGALTFRGGLILESGDRDFGGLSALQVGPGGEQFLALSDRGQWLRGRIIYRGKAPVAIANAEVAPILGADGRSLRSRGWYDTEALASDNGIFWVGIERVHQIVRFDYARDGLRARGTPVTAPPGMKLLPYNKGIECLAAVPLDPASKEGPPAGTLIAISERGLDNHGHLKGFLVGGPGGVFSLRRRDEFDVSDCALTGNRLLVLERRFSWMRGIAMRIRSVPLASIRPGALIDGPELIFADMAHQIDNMEGLAVHRDPSGATVLTLVSDDNFSPLQRTLLLQFTLEGKTSSLGGESDEGREVAKRQNK